MYNLSETEKLDSNEAKLAYILQKLNLSTKEVAQRLEVSSSLISQIKNNYEESHKLKKIHLYAICFAYKIPLEIFENRAIDTTEKIDSVCMEAKEEYCLFEKNNAVLHALMGTWYMYSYMSNPKVTEIWETKTEFYKNYSVVDEHDNKGLLHIGKNQSIILKESAGSKNITSITFDNARIFYNLFLFSRVSKSNYLNKELFNFGICSRKKLNKELVKELLGDIKNTQLQIDYALLERVATSKLEE